MPNNGYHRSSESQVNRSTRSVVLQHPQLDGLFTGHLSPTHHELVLNLSFFNEVDAARSPQMKG